jgi:protein subunit release factor B
MISPGKWDALRRLMHSLDIDEKKIREHFIRGSGRGGQKINKSAICVQLIYDDIEIRSQKSRSQADNRFWARRELCEKIAQRRSDRQSEQEALSAKIRRQKNRRTRRAKEKMVADKRHQSFKKRLRRPPSSSDED